MLFCVWKPHSQSHAIFKGTACAEKSKGIDWSVVVMADQAASVLAKLRNKAKSSGISQIVIAIEGIDGAGKTTIINELHRQFNDDLMIYERTKI